MYFSLFHYSFIIVFCTVGNDYVFFIISLFIHYWLSLKKVYSTLLNSTQLYSTIHTIHTTYYVPCTTYHILRTTYYVPHTMYYVSQTIYHVLRTTYYEPHTNNHVLRTTYYIPRTTYYVLI